jgi:hypothetical protein
LAFEAFPPLLQAAIALEPETAGRVVRGPAAPELKGRVEFGGPLVTPIDKRYRPDDADLQAFIRGRADRLRFLVAHMSVNFPMRLPPPLSRAVVQVALHDDGNTGETIAYSLFPTHAGTSYDVTRGFSISPTLTVGPVTAGPGSAGASTVDHGTRDFVVGGPELSAHPSWSFQPTPAQELTGATRLVMIIQIPKGQSGTLSVDLAADLEQGRFRKRRISLPGADEANPQAVSF